MSWLGDVWKRNRNFVGNALKNVAPVVGALTGGLGGVAIGGLGAALGQAAREGSNIGDILKTGAQNAMLTGSGQKAIGGIKGILARGGAKGLPIAPGAGVQREIIEGKAPGLVGPLGANPSTVPILREMGGPGLAETTGLPHPLGDLYTGSPRSVYGITPTMKYPSQLYDAGRITSDRARLVGQMPAVRIEGSMGEVTKQLAGMPKTVGPLAAPSASTLPASVLAKGSALSKTGDSMSAWKKAASWINEHDKLAELGLRGLTTGIEGIAGKGQRAAQERLLAAQAAQMEYELAREQESQRALQGLREQLAQTMPVFGTKRKHVWEE